MSDVDTAFTGSVPAIYNHLLGPLLFQPYAEEIGRRVRSLSPGHVLETAAGTGILTEALHQALPDAEIIATDLNPAMHEVAAQRVRSEKVSFEPADAQDLRFADGTFDLVVCQFGVMFLPDKVKGNSEAHRVLRDGGQYIAVIWDRLDRNPASQLVHDAVAALFPNDPPQFLARTPFGYSDPNEIDRDMRAAGFRHVDIDTVELKSLDTSPKDAALGLVTGCPLRAEIEERDASVLDRAVRAAEQALKSLDGLTGFDSRLSAHVVTATK
jgi:ubiquinone/menaquinone biosynthesis C-methylase UbiE